MPKTLRVGVARSIGLAYYAGFFFAFRRTLPDVQLHVVQLGSREILEAVEARSLDAGLLSPPKRLPRALAVTHRFEDEFVLITPPDHPLAQKNGRTLLRSLRKRLLTERWLLIDHGGETGRALRAWLREEALPVEPAMELDSFDVIVNLVALGLGVSVVPHRVLALYGDRRRVGRIRMQPQFVRELAVVVRKNRVHPEPLATFIGSILF